MTTTGESATAMTTTTTDLDAPRLAPAVPLPIHDRPRTIERRTVDDTASLVGAAVGSLALVWLLYERLLPFSGTLGFLVLWYVVFLALHAGVTALGNPRPVVVDRFAQALVAGGAAIVLFALGSAVFYVFAKGFPAYRHLSFFTHDMAGVRRTAPLTQGGILHAVVGTGITVGIATAISLPLGIGTAIYMTEVGGRLSRTVRTVVEAMTALPDILAGLFVYTVLILALHVPRTGFPVAIALAVTMIPIIARSAEVVLRVVPGGLREASLALGASQWATVRRVVLPTARAGLATALILGTARVIGETAPLLILSGSTSYLNTNPFSQAMTSLPLFIFDSVRSGESAAISRGFGAAAVLLALVLVLFSAARFLARDKGARTRR